MNSLQKSALVTFLAVFILAVATGGIVGFVLSDETDDDVAVAPDHVEVDNPQYDPERVTSDRTPGEANIEMDSLAVEKDVVIHAGGMVTEREISPLVNTLIESGHNVTVVADEAVDDIIMDPILIQDQAVSQVPPPGDDEEPQLSGELEEAHGFVSIGVSSYTDEDLEEISKFVADDGRMVMAIDPDQEFDFGGGHSNTFSELGLYTEPGYVYNLEENDLNYQRVFAEPDGEPLLTAGVERVVFDTATTVHSLTSDEQIEPIDSSELSTTRDETDAPVLVRDGSVTLVGDTGFMTPENTQRADNDVLVGNIADFLVEADRDIDDETDDETDGNGAPDDEEGGETVTIDVGPDGEPVFEPEFVEIEPGTTVEFKWRSDGYNIVPVFQEPDDLDWDGVEEPQDEGYVHEHTFEEDGIHEFISEPHEDDMMFGVIIVGEPEP